MSQPQNLFLNGQKVGIKSRRAFVAAVFRPPSLVVVPPMAHCSASLQLLNQERPAIAGHYKVKT
jgi:hypothetical protein